ncbi:hypothetical protein IGI04_030357, partial [Brassica rapa subsp. trilocularis]
FFRSETGLEDSQKTFQNTLGKSSNTFYARKLPTKSSGSVPKSSAQSGIHFEYVVQMNDVKWSPSLSMWRNYI